MTEATTGDPTPPADPNASGRDLKETGRRIELLLDRLERSLGDAFYDVEELVRLLSDLYGAGLLRAIELAGADVERRLADDELVGSLMLVHGIHPDGLEARAAAAVASVAPLAASRGGAVEIVSVSASAGTIHLSVVSPKPDGLGEAVARLVEQAVPDAVVTVSAQESGTPIKIGRKPVSIS